MGWVSTYNGAANGNDDTSDLTVDNSGNLYAVEFIVLSLQAATISIGCKQAPTVKRKNNFIEISS